MAGGKPFVLGGLEFRVRPDYLPRRLLPFLPFLESNNASFQIRIKRLRPDNGEEVDIRAVNLRFRVAGNGDRLFLAETFTYPELEIGQTRTEKLEKVYVTHPGQIVIYFASRQYVTPGPNGVLQPAINWVPLYSYRVHYQDVLWTPLVAIVTGVVVATLTALLVAA